MKWSILILTMPERKELFWRLMNCLAPQVKYYPDVEISVKVSEAGEPVGVQRRRMMESAKGEYICFVDDDDMVSERYVSTIYPLLTGVDYVGFPVKVFRNGAFLQMAYHSLKHRDWKEYGLDAFRDISHLNPMKRELAIQGEMEGGYGEDGRWAKRLRELGIVKTENYIPETMYHYFLRG